jgi:hypothetical protein
MDLEQFVAATLVQISKGVVSAQKDIAEMGGSVNPTTFGLSNSPKSIAGVPEQIEFDVAVVSSETRSAKAGAKVAWVLSVGASGGKASSSEATNRVRFKVPLVLPVDLEFGARHRDRREDVAKALAKAQAERA